MPRCLGKYDVVGRIAAGGMAEVFRARQVGAEGVAKEFAVKRILPHLCADEDFIAMLIDEARILVTLDHPNIVSVHEFTRTEDGYILAMELVRGRSLAQVLARCGARRVGLGVEDVLFIGSQVAAALGYAHACRDAAGRPLDIVHRDVSPQNVLVSWEGHVKVVDFGVAKAACKLMATRAGTVKGKFAYMSPEQARGEVVDGRTDIFALGIVLWEMLARRRLFAADSDFSTLRRVLDAEIPALSEVDARVPPSVAGIVARALARLRAERYADARAFESDLLIALHRVQPAYSQLRLGEKMQTLFDEEITHERRVAGGPVSPMDADTLEVEAPLHGSGRAPVEGRAAHAAQPSAATDSDTEEEKQPSVAALRLSEPMPSGRSSPRFAWRMAHTHRGFRRLGLALLIVVIGGAVTILAQRRWSAQSAVAEPVPTARGEQSAGPSQEGVEAACAAEPCEVGKAAVDQGSPRETEQPAAVKRPTLRAKARVRQLSPLLKELR